MPRFQEPVTVPLFKFVIFQCQTLFVVFKMQLVVVPLIRKSTSLATPETKVTFVFSTSPSELPGFVQTAQIMALVMLPEGSAVKQTLMVTVLLVV